MAAEPNPRDELYRLIDQLAPPDVPAARRYLELLVRDTASFNRATANAASQEALRDPVVRALADAPLDDEPTTPEDIRAMDEGRLAYRRGESVSLDDLMRERGRGAARFVSPPTAHATSGGSTTLRRSA